MGGTYPYPQHVMYPPPPGAAVTRNTAHNFHPPFYVDLKIRNLCWLSLVGVVSYPVAEWIFGYEHKGEKMKVIITIQSIMIS